jgi:NADPH-dependent 7-cyano-7-deazaguanine reductase QueF
MNDDALENLTQRWEELRLAELRSLCDLGQAPDVGEIAVDAAGAR